MALEPPPNLAKYDIPKGTDSLLLRVLNCFLASLRFIGAHGTLLKEYLTEDSEKMYTRLTNWCKHPSNKKVRDMAFTALEVFLSQVAKELVSGARDFVHDKNTFQVRGCDLMFAIANCM